jgi:hypothetical protein
LAGADVEKVALGMGYDKRIGRGFLNAGIGYGGSCFPKDVSAFIRIAEKYGYNFELLKRVEGINTEQRENIIKKIEKVLWVLKGKTLGILGLSFKPDTDDIRESPSIEIIKALQAEGARIKAYDPQAMTKAKEVSKDIQYCQSPYEVCENSEALIILTDWEEFKQLDLKRVKDLLKNPLIIDGRNIFDPQEVEKMGFKYILGKRLYPLTKITNKHLLPIFDKPMVYYPIETLVSAGIEDILIVTGGNNAGDFLRLLGNGQSFGLKHINYTYQEGEGGIAQALGLAEHFAKKEKVVVILGDNIIEGDIIKPFKRSL